MPGRHAPVDEPHGRVRPSSVSASQSLLMPSQISGDGTHAPHTPPSSMTPLQLLSTPSQISVGVAPHVPHALRRPSSTTPLQLLSKPSHATSAGGAQSVHGHGPGVAQAAAQFGGATPEAGLQN